METQPNPVQPARREFIRELGLSSAALMALYCMGSLTACSSSKSDPTPTPTPTPTPNPNTTTGFTGNADAAAGKIDFTLDLTASAYQTLKTVGNFVNVGGVIVANAQGNKFVAVGRICTHQNGNLGYRLAENDFQCDFHGGLYQTNGTVKAAPPTVGVKAYTATLSANGNSLRVAE